VIVPLRFASYVDGMLQIESEDVQSKAQADKILEKYEEVRLSPLHPPSPDSITLLVALLTFGSSFPPSVRPSPSASSC
jgi:hypothetical protein